jgi:hypothetical protein
MTETAPETDPGDDFRVRLLDSRWTPLDEYEARTDEYGEPVGPLPWISLIATLEHRELYGITPNCFMIRSFCEAILDLRQRCLDKSALLDAVADRLP